MSYEQEIKGEIKAGKPAALDPFSNRWSEAAFTLLVAACLFSVSATRASWAARVDTAIGSCWGSNPGAKFSWHAVKTRGKACRRLLRRAQTEASHVCLLFDCPFELICSRGGSARVRKKRRRLETSEASPRSGPRGRREACDGGTSTGPGPGPERGRREGAASTPARSAWTALEREVGFSLRKRRQQQAKVTTWRMPASAHTSSAAVIGSWRVCVCARCDSMCATGSRIQAVGFFFSITNPSLIFTPNNW